MIQITPQMRILVAIEPADFRKGIDGLARVCKEVLKRRRYGGPSGVRRSGARRIEAIHRGRATLSGRLPLVERWRLALRRRCALLRIQLLFPFFCGVCYGVCA